MKALSRLLPLVLVLLFTTAAAGASRQAASSRTNIVLMIADDLGWTDLGCYGSRFYDTPNLDRMAREGLRFTQAYAACPVCSPTRASIQTGRWPQRTGITDYIGAAQPEKWARNTRMLPATYSDRLAVEETTIAEALKPNGYATFFAGKWHLGPEGFWPENQGYDVNKGGTGQGSPNTGSKYFSPYANPRLEDGPPGEHLPDRIATETAKFIAANKARPFFACVPFYDVHTPLMAREDLRKKYEARAAERPAAGEKWGKEGERQVRLVQDHAVYAGMVEAMDQAAGKILAAIQENGVADRTLVIFTSDNGGLSTSEGHPTSNVPLRGGKGWLYEGGIRVPFIVRWPGVVKPGTETDAVIASPDVFPTLLEAAGLPSRPDAHRDGKSFIATLKGGKSAARTIYWHYPHYGNQGGFPGAAIREGDWKLIERYEDGTAELYNVREDLSERRDRAAEEPDRVRDLRAKLAAWRKDVGARMPTGNPRFQP